MLRMSTPEGREATPIDIDPMQTAGMDPDDVDAYWNTVTDPETFDSNDW